MTELELRAQVCRRAEQWLGCREADGSHRAIIDLYNTITPLPRGYKMRYDDPWCAAFVSAVGAACGLTAVLLPECGCEPMIALYRAAGRWEEADDAAPRPGDLIFYDWEDSGAGDCRGAADHVGLVTENDDDLLTVIEGNLSDAVGSRRIYSGARFIRGFARPDYLSAAAASPVGEGLAPPADTGADPTTGGAYPFRALSPAPTDTGDPSVGGGALDDPSAFPVGTSIARPSSGGEPEQTDDQWSSLRSVPLPTLSRGDRGAAVQSAQLLLIAQGYRCGPWGADGDFGAATLGAVYRFQQGRRLKMDGEIGAQTWAKLVGEKE